MGEIQSKKFGDWAVVFWKKGSKTLSIAQNQGDPGTTDFWMVGTTTRQFDYESGWLPNKKWSTAIKGHFSKDKAIQMAKEQVMKEDKGLKEGCLDHIKDKWQSELDKGVEPKILMDPWIVCEGMKWLGKDGWIRVEEVLTPTEYEEPYPDFYMEIFDQHTCAISHDIYTINEINSYVRNTKARLVNNGIRNLVNKDIKENKMERNIKESRKPFTSDIPNNLLEIQNNMEDVFTIHNLSIATSESANGLARDILTLTGTKVGELSFTPASYYMAGPREDIYWEGSTLEEFEADVTDLSYTL